MSGAKFCKQGILLLKYIKLLLVPLTREFRGFRVEIGQKVKGFTLLDK